jgi:hypothetical protein
MFVTSIPLFPPKVLNLSFMVSDHAFSPALSVNNVSESSPAFKKPVIYEMSCVSMYTGGSSHRVTPCRQLSIILT